MAHAHAHALLLELIDKIKRERSTVRPLTRVIVQPKTGEVERIARTSLAQKLPPDAAAVERARAAIEAMKKKAAPARAPTHGGRDADGFVAR
jgi:hypothetical protein